MKFDIRSNTSGILAGIPHGSVRALHVLVLNLVLGIVSGTKRDSTYTAREFKSACTTARALRHP